jgi:hypothetical protein
MTEIFNLKLWQQEARLCVTEGTPAAVIAPGFTTMPKKPSPKPTSSSKPMQDKKTGKKC